MMVSFNMSDKRFERFVDEVALMAVEIIGEVCRDRTREALLQLPREMSESAEVNITFPVKINALALKTLYTAAKKRKTKQKQMSLFD